MTKGTTSKGKRHNKSHIVCRRCNQSSFHIQKHLCARCGYPNARIRNTTNHRLGSNKARRRKTTGTGRCRYLKTMPRRFKNGFQSGTEAKRMVSVSAK